MLLDALSEVTKFYTPLKLRVFVDDITAPVMGKNEEVGRKGLKLSVNENGKEGKSKMIGSCGFLEEELRQCSKEEGVTMTDSVETLRVDLRTRVKSLGAKEKARRKKCRVRFSLIKKNKGLPEELHEDGGQEVATSGYGASKDVRSSCSEDRPHRKIKREADGSSSGQKEHNLTVPVHGSICPWSVQTWPDGVWIGPKAHRTKRSLVETGF